MTRTLSSEIVEDLRARNPALTMSVRKNALIDEARAAFPTGTINAAIGQYLGLF